MSFVPFLPPQLLCLLPVAKTLLFCLLAIEESLLLGLVVFAQSSLIGSLLGEGGLRVGSFCHEREHKNLEVGLPIPRPRRGFVTGAGNSGARLSTAYPGKTRIRKYRSDVPASRRPRSVPGTAGEC